MNYTISKENILAIAELGNEAKAYMMRQFPAVFFKVGDFIKSPYSDIIYEIEEITYNGKRFNAKNIYMSQEVKRGENFYKHWDMEGMVLATEEEIKRFIPDYIKQDETPLEKAKRLYKKGTKFIDFRGVTRTVLGDYYNVTPDGCIETNSTGYYYACVFHKGQWAEIIEQ